ncbi:hypothetical protein NDU88_005827 [Pleurodeles waltl]|uniref:Uncharacterized protein n=1 Tax=Pleurodeles waltl TaxID=8319 RepID=A0AAV7LQM6_PLEWA|nr:hypothetical protein NDU88_005827 [Pleurodeles waltl]
MKGELIVSASFLAIRLINWLVTTPTEYLMHLLGSWSGRERRWPPYLGAPRGIRLGGWRGPCGCRKQDHKTSGGSLNIWSPDPCRGGPEKAAGKTAAHLGKKGLVRWRSRVSRGPNGSSRRDRDNDSRAPSPSVSSAALLIRTSCPTPLLPPHLQGTEASVRPGGVAGTPRLPQTGSQYLRRLSKTYGALISVEWAQRKQLEGLLRTSAGKALSGGGVTPLEAGADRPVRNGHNDLRAPLPLPVVSSVALLIRTLCPLPFTPFPSPGN